MLKRTAARVTRGSGEEGFAPSAIPLRFRDDPLVWASWLYFQDGLTQHEIAGLMGVSRATVNSYLAEARARGIVRVDIEPARLRAVELAQSLRRRFGLADCVVIPAGNGARPLLRRLGEAGAGVLRTLVRPGDALGVAWSRTVLAVADTPGLPALPDLSVVQVSGSAGAGFAVSPELCASRMAAALGARCVALTVPALVSSPAVRDLLAAEPAVRERLDLVRGVNVLLFGIGTVRPDSLVFASGLLSAEDARPYLARRASAVVAGRFVDEAGRPLRGPLDARMVGPTLDDLAAVRTRIAVAGGLGKVGAILACLRGGHATVLVTDEGAARGVLAADGDRPGRGRPNNTSTEGGTRMPTKKLINDAKGLVEEMLEGIVAAHPKHVRLLPGQPRSLVAVDSPRPGKVGLVVGGGSGHEPTFLGFVGRGLADAAAVGNVFASPPPDPIVACAKAVDGGAGVLFVYGNYAGDVMNFDMAAEMAGLDGVEIRTVVTTDDIASAPPARRGERRGVAGNFFIFKVAGAACDLMKTMDECERLTRKANDHTFTIGVALSACSSPHTLKPNFELGADEMEIGIGIHGEPGVSRESLKPADAVVDDIMDRLFAEMPAERGARVAVLVNSLGATPLMELYGMNRRVHQRLAARGIGVHATWVGPYCTSLDMAGASITLMLLDDELQALLDRPCDAAMFRAG